MEREYTLNNSAFKSYQCVGNWSRFRSIHVSIVKKVKTFTGIDLSNAVIKRHLEFLKDTNDFIRLYHLKAHEIDQLPDNKTYDTIIINSVAQHFPNIDYFEEVLQKSLDQLSSNGSLFIGDISNYDVHKEMIRENLLTTR